MKWIIALAVSAVMFFAGYYHASRYETDGTEKTENQENAEPGEPAEPTS